MKALRFLLSLLLIAPCIHAHESAPDPLLFYNFTSKHLVIPQPPAEGVEAAPFRLKSQYGPELLLGGAPLAEDSSGGLRFANLPGPHRLAGEAAETFRPTRDFTLSVWFTLDAPKPVGALYSCFTAKGENSGGLALGYELDRPFVALSTSGGEKSVTRLVSERRLIPGRWHHLAATYDGAELRLFLDGQAVASSRERLGDIRWPADAPTWIGGFREGERAVSHEGRLATVKLFDVCANTRWVIKEFAEGAALREQPGETPPGAAPQVVVEPYLQWVRGDEATVMWETNFPCRGTVMWGEGPDCPQAIEEPAPVRIHEVVLRNLRPEMLYYFKTRSPAPAGSLETALQTLQTAMKPSSPFAFVVFCDTQAHPEVLEPLAAAAWELRPNFVMIGGDLVTTGKNREHWTGHFFPHMRPLISHVPFFPVLGNHEQNAIYYYDYVHLPEPEYYYTFTQGDVQFFMLDSNKDLRPGSEQYRWLEKELAASRSLWKIAMHHHPPFSSDDDYGNDWKHPLAEMTFGETDVRPIVTLYDKYAVDIVWTGHIHSYERTWMIRNGEPVEKGGTTYLVTGGAGGNLESAGPYRPAFQRHVKTGHHFTYVTAFGGELDLMAYDLEGRMFDHFTLRKERTTPVEAR